jgi:NADH-quinone oxidoreductase subunit L
MKNKFYVDELYQLIFIRPAHWISDTLSYKIIDRTIIDGILHGIAKIGLWLGNALRNWFDLPVVNGAGDALSGGARGLGGMMRKIQTGRVQQYMVAAIITAVVVGVIILLLQPLG